MRPGRAPESSAAAAAHSEFTHDPGVSRFALDPRLHAEAAPRLFL